MSNERQARLADRIRVLIAERLEKGLRDPRLGFVTITDVRVTGDLQHASVFYTVYGTDKERKQSAAALRSATGLIRSEVGKALGIRLTPSLTFTLDALPDQARTFEDALAQARAKDTEIARGAQGASYAGGEAPYRVDDVPEAPDEVAGTVPDGLPEEDGPWGDDDERPAPLDDEGDRR